MKPQIVVVGSLNLDLAVRVARFPEAGETVMGDSVERFCGGKGANQAYAAAKLGAAVCLVGNIGADTAGDEQVAHLSSAGVDTRWLSRDSAVPSGTALIFVGTDGQNRIVAVPGANAAFSPIKLSAGREAFRSARLLLLQLEVPLDTVAAAIRYAQEDRLPIVLDPAPAPAGRLPPDLLAADFVTPNISELSAVTGRSLGEDSSMDEIARAATDLHRCGARCVLAKIGPRGVLLADSNGVAHVPGFRVTPVDTTAAGDCFNAAFAVHLLEGKPVYEAARFANAAAACSVRRMGAQASMPSLAEVERLLSSGSVRQR